MGWIAQDCRREKLLHEHVGSAVRVLLPSAHVHELPALYSHGTQSSPMLERRPKRDVCVQQGRRRTDNSRVEMYAAALQPMTSSPGARSAVANTPSPA